MAKKTTPKDRKAESLLNRSWETVKNKCILYLHVQIYIFVSGAIRKSLREETSKEEIAFFLPCLQWATGFLADTQAESVRVTTCAEVPSNKARSVLWQWSGDRVLKCNLCTIPCEGEYFFGPALNRILEKA